MQDFSVFQCWRLNGNRPYWPFKSCSCCFLTPGVSHRPPLSLTVSHRLSPSLQPNCRKSAADTTFHLRTSSRSGISCRQFTVTVSTLILCFLFSALNFIHLLFVAHLGKRKKVWEKKSHHLDGEDEQLNSSSSRYISWRNRRSAWCPSAGQSGVKSIVLSHCWGYLIFSLLVEGHF